MSSSRMKQLPGISKKTGSIITIEIPNHQPLTKTRDDDLEGYDDNSDYEFETKAEFRPSKLAGKVNLKDNDYNDKEEELTGSIGESSKRKGKQAIKAFM